MVGRAGMNAPYFGMLDVPLNRRPGERRDLVSFGFKKSLDPGVRQGDED
jgi:hypothetical protein